jgi:anti-sigma28 factor (negative regulator of flagellin synthesis)
MRQARVLALRAQIRRGQYDVDSKIGGLIDEVVRGEV